MKPTQKPKPAPKRWIPEKGTSSQLQRYVPRPKKR